MQLVELIIIYPDINWALWFAFLSVWVIYVPGIAPGRKSRWEFHAAGAAELPFFC